ncbi:unnamed protein product [Ascophyllum nodosum]
MAPACLGRGRRWVRGAREGEHPAREGGGILLPTALAVRRRGVREFGVMESMQNKLINRNVGKQEKLFRDQMKDLSLLDKFDLDDYVKIIETPLEKFSAKMPWNKDKEELKNMKMQKNILDNLTPTQRKNPDLIRAGHRQAIADRIGCTVEDVNNMLAAFREIKAMHGWLSTRRKKRERIPRTQEEMNVMASDPSGTMLIKFMRMKKGGSGQRPSYGF